MLFPTPIVSFVGKKREKKERPEDKKLRKQMLKDAKREQRLLRRG
jgi:hypothetical protein